MKLLNSDTAAITAEPMAMPLVMALVVLPTASRSARVCRDFLVLGFAHRLLVVAHFADAVGVVGHGPEDVHRDRVAGERQHADAAHGHAEGDERGLGAGIDQHAGENRRDDDHHRRHAAFVADGKALDDIGGMAGLQLLARLFTGLVLGAGVVLGAFVQQPRPG